MAVKSGRPINWIHMDLKGAIPPLESLLHWVDYLADAGFTGVVWEYEDRLPWRSWPGVFRPGYTLDEWARVWGRCRQRGLDVTPLIQTHGHMEWLLRHRRWADWREGGHFQELCPQHPEVAPALTGWIDEVLALHPDSRYIHLGADETWHLGKCPRCREKASQAAGGRMEILVHHVGRLCRHALSRGVRPIIWADMFWREGRTELAASLPPEVVLADWQYRGPGPFPTATALAHTGLEVWGASAIRGGYDLTQTVAALAERVDNVVGWQRCRDRGEVGGVLHTNWGRSCSSRPPYGPWEGWLPGLIAAGDPQRWAVHPIRPVVALVDQGMAAGNARACLEVLAELESVRATAPEEQSALRWWVLSLRYRVLYLNFVTHGLAYHGLSATAERFGLDPDVVESGQYARSKLRRDLEDWETDARACWREVGLSDEDEFFASRLHPLRRFLAQDWVPVREARDGKLDAEASERASDRGLTVTIDAAVVQGVVDAGARVPRSH